MAVVAPPHHPIWLCRSLQRTGSAHSRCVANVDAAYAALYFFRPHRRNLHGIEEDDSFSMFQNCSGSLIRAALLARPKPPIRAASSSPAERSQPRKSTRTKGSSQLVTTSCVPPSRFGQLSGFGFPFQASSRAKHSVAQNRSDRPSHSLLMRGQVIKRTPSSCGL